YLRLSFYAPAGGTARMRFARGPARVLVDGRPASLGSELDTGLFRLSLLAGAGKVRRTVDLLFSGEPPAPEMPAPALRWEFPSRIDYAVRPDVKLASVPHLVLADTGLRFLIENPSTAGRVVTVRWLSRASTVALGPRQKKSLRLPLDRRTGVHSMTLSLESGGEKSELPVAVLQLPKGVAAVYPFDFDRDGNQEIVLENAKLRVVVDPASGGRVMQFVDKRTDRNAASTAGLLRDQFALAEP